MDTPFFASTRGQIVTLLRRESRTVDELAVVLEVSDNAVRAHLATLERDGLVEQHGIRRGTSKLATTYGLTSQTEWLFPKAYGAVLAELLAVVRERLSPDDLADVLRVVGKRIAARQSVAADTIDARLAHAVDIVITLGGLGELERSGETFVIRGYDCPLAAVALHHPDVCAVVEALLADSVGVAFHERCDRGERPTAASRAVSRSPPRERPSPRAG
jgi:predicted ArsR family transcriptional regulator